MTLYMRRTTTGAPGTIYLYGALMVHVFDSGSIYITRASSMQSPEAENEANESYWLMND